MTSPKLKNLYYKLDDTPVGSKTDYFLFKLVDPKGGSRPSVAWDFCQVTDKLCLHFSIRLEKCMFYEIAVSWILDSYTVIPKECQLIG